ncbi:hypothetical protein [Variovorax sp. 350MFTsu5.1]|uniref:hypothetical protein n=1 Tax=Variovorax sp. 350MFTsu5.1 TaxID=3158365 RepID=UPI003AB06786
MTTAPETLYLQLRRLVASMPDLASGDIRKPEDLQWLGRAAALIEESGDLADFVQFKSCADNINPMRRVIDARKMEAIVHRALARAELQAPVSAQGAFIAAGDTLNAFAAVAKVLTRAKQDILMVDAYADQTIITGFAVTAPDGVALRILGADKEARKATLRPAVANWVQQFGHDRPIEVRVAPQAGLHDRLILIDGTEAWFAGQSFNGMAQKSHTSIERSDPELAAMKVQAYETLWAGAQPL